MNEHHKGEDVRAGITVRQPVLDGSGDSDYERYIRTDALLLLQKEPEERVHRDELLFQVTHQSHELWLKLATSEVHQASEWIADARYGPARRVLRRAVMALEFITGQLAMLEQVSAWEYQDIRRVLGHGSGFDSPGFRSLRRELPVLWNAFEGALAQERTDLAKLYIEASSHDRLYDVAEEMANLDTRLQEWRMRHYRVVVRVIGDGVVGTQGTPVEVVGRLIQVLAFPKLWEVRNTLTRLSDQSSG